MKNNLTLAVIGVTQTKFGELWDKSLLDLLAQSQLGALADAGIAPQAIDQIFTGTMCAELLSGQAHVGALAADILGLNVPSIRVEGACASGGLALRAGVMALQSGAAQVVMVNGVEKLTDASTSEVTSALMGASMYELEQYIGASFPALFALISRIYMERYGITRHDLAQVSIKNHLNALLNPDAHFRKEISLQDYFQATMIADPLSLFDCSPLSDGAASVILSTLDFAKMHRLKPVYMIASADGVDTINIAHRKSLLGFQATQQVVQRAYGMAGIGPHDVDLVELHDAFTTSELMSLEDLGFYEPGKAAAAVVRGDTMLNAKLSVNPSGGLKARGHPVGATGIAQVVEIVRQLRGECGKRQVHDARIGMTHNMGGAGTTVVVHIFAKDKNVCR